MVRRSTWILLVILAVLVGFTWFFQKYQVNKADNTATVTPTASKANLYEIDSSQASEIAISDSSGGQIGLYRNPVTSDWAVSDVPVEQSDSFQIESIIAQLFSLQVQESLPQTPPLESVGLVSPAYTITIIEPDDSQQVTYVGSPTAIGSGYYVRVDDGQVVIVDKVVMDNVIKMISNPPILATPTPEATSPIENGAGATSTP
jgi:hypothetical protein